MKRALVFAVALLAVAPVAASAAVFDLHYTTFADGVFPAVTVDAALTTDDGSFYGAPGNLLVTAISGTRGGIAISGLADPFSEIFYPPSPYYVDNFGITFSAGGFDYNLVRNNSSFYQEFATPSAGGLSEGRIIFDGALTLGPAAAVPEPAAWALMLGGLGLTGGVLRRRRALAA